LGVNSGEKNVINGENYTNLVTLVGKLVLEQENIKKTGQNDFHP
jgi:hypothetical protein